MSAPKQEIRSKRSRVEDIEENRGSKRRCPDESNHSCTVFIANLGPTTVDETIINSVFSQFGEIKAIRLQKHEDTGRLKGFGFVEFTHPEAAKRAASQNISVCGRTVKIEVSTSFRSTRNASHGSTSQRTTGQHIDHGSKQKVPLNGFNTNELLNNPLVRFQLQQIQQGLLATGLNLLNGNMGAAGNMKGINMGGMTGPMSGLNMGTTNGMNMVSPSTTNAMNINSANTNMGFLTGMRTGSLMNGMNGASMIQARAGPNGMNLDTTNGMNMNGANLGLPMNVMNMNGFLTTGTNVVGMGTSSLFTGLNSTGVKSGQPVIDGGDGPQLEIQLSRVTASQRAKVVGSKTVFVGNLSDSVNDDTMFKLFSPCGDIATIQWVNDKVTGRFKGCAFLTFYEEKSTVSAVHLNGTVLLGRPMRVDFAEDRERGRRFS